MKQFISWLSKFSVCLILLAFLEVLITSGYAIKFDKYTAFTWIIQTCFIIICLYISLIDWETGEFWPN